MRSLHQLLSDETGVATVEYALLLALVIIASLAAWQNLGGAVRDMIEESSSVIANGA
ncbi:MAG: Flp family type IVb pilin [candidate division WS1 bacterium]|jgi:Flp pilus assembly pilin Flp|nr:Flp family type IVb pilin [candidate division WS1 bacterium]